MEIHILSIYVEKYIHKKVLFETVPINNALFLDINNFLIFFIKQNMNYNIRDESIIIFH